MARRGQLGAVSILPFVADFLATESAVKTPAATGQWHALTGNSVILTPGTWILNGYANYGEAAASGGTFLNAELFAANGADSAASPAALSVDSFLPTFRFADEGVTDIRLSLTPTRITVSINTTVFLVTFANMGTPANARTRVGLYAERIR